MRKTIMQLTGGLILIYLALFTAGCASHNAISGLIANEPSTPDGVKISSDDLEECDVFIEENVEKRCAVLKNFDCDSCRDYIDQLQQT